MIILGVFWGYHHVRKHPYGNISIVIRNTGIASGTVSYKMETLLPRGVPRSMVYDYVGITLLGVTCAEVEYHCMDTRILYNLYMIIWVLDMYYRYNQILYNELQEI